MFGNDSLPSRFFSYGALAPVAGLELFEEQVHLQHRYRNKLVEIERRRRGEASDVLRQYRPDLVVLEAQLAEAEALLEAERARLQAQRVQRGSKKLPATETAHGKGLAAQLKEMRGRYSAMRKEAFAAVDVKTALVAVEEASRAALRQAREASNLFWPNYLIVEQAAQSFRRGAPPTFQSWRWDHRGKVAMQLQGGLTVKDLMKGGDNRLRLEITGSSRGGRRSFAKVSVRVGSTAKDGAGKGGGKPVWCVVPVIWHRPLPADGIIKWVYLRREREGERWRWAVQFVVAREAGWAIPDAARTGAVGIDLGWRLLPERGLRVAFWHGSDGDRGELILPLERTTHLWGHTDGLHGIRDMLFNVAKIRLSSFLNDGGDFGLPEWLCAETAHLTQWRSLERLGRLVRRWARERFYGDEDIFRWLWGWQAEGPDGKLRREGWRSQDLHLHYWEDGQRSAAIRWRDDLYRNFVVGLRRRYRLACIEDADWRNLAEHAAPECGEGENAVARSNRFIAAPGRLATLIRDGFAETLRVDPNYTTQTCAYCGRLDPFDAAKELVRICASCGHREDQDGRAARNLLRAASGGTANESPATAR